MASEDNEHSALAFLDYGIKNGYFVNNATQITRKFIVIKNNLWLSFWLM
jgi:hypothetical protein